MKATERNIEKFDRLAKELTKAHEETRRKGGMSQSKKEQMIEAYERKEYLKREIKKDTQDRAQKKNPILPRW